MNLLNSVSHRTWKRVRIVIGVAVVVAATLVVIATMVHRQLTPDDDPVEESSSATPTPTATCTPAPKTAPSMTPAGKSGPTKEQVASFEAAAVLLDPDQRSNALIPVATCEYITSSFDGGNDDADAMDSTDVRVKLVVIKAKKVDGDIATVTSQFTVEGWNDGQLVDKPEVQTHTTSWVWTSKGWLAYTEPE